jgi:hypothetical protein
LEPFSEAGGDALVGFSNEAIELGRAHLPVILAVWRKR